MSDRSPASLARRAVLPIETCVARLASVLGTYCTAHGDEVVQYMLIIASVWLYECGRVCQPPYLLKRAGYVPLAIEGADDIRAALE